jgi:hypothetical protein
MCFFGHALPSTEFKAAPKGLVPLSRSSKWAHCYAVHQRALPRLVAYLEEVERRPEGHPAGGKMYIDGSFSLYREHNPDSSRCSPTRCCRCSAAPPAAWPRPVARAAVAQAAPRRAGSRLPRRDVAAHGPLRLERAHGLSRRADRNAEACGRRQSSGAPRLRHRQGRRLLPRTAREPGLAFAHRRAASAAVEAPEASLPSTSQVGTTNRPVRNGRIVFAFSSCLHPRCRSDRVPAAGQTASAAEALRVRRRRGRRARPGGNNRHRLTCRVHQPALAARQREPQGRPGG